MKEQLDCKHCNQQWGKRPATNTHALSIYISFCGKILSLKERKKKNAGAKPRKSQTQFGHKLSSIRKAGLLKVCK